MCVFNCFQSGSLNISVSSSAIADQVRGEAAWALGRRFFAPAESAAGTPTAAPNAQRAGAERQRGEEGETEAGGGEAQGREHGHETAYTPESCVSLRVREPHQINRTGRIGWTAMHNERWRYWGPLGVVLVVAFGLRLWGIKQGLPYVYDVDEYGHFVPEAVRMFGHGLNPHYFVNPPALTYLLHVVFGVWFGVLGLGSHVSIAREFALHPERFFLAGAGGGGVARDGLGVAALPARRAPLRSRRRPARERRDGGRLLTGFLRPSRAQRRAHPGAADALAARHRRHPAPGTDSSTTCSPGSAWALRRRRSTRRA